MVGAEDPGHDGGVWPTRCETRRGQGPRRKEIADNWQQMDLKWVGRTGVRCLPAVPNWGAYTNIVHLNLQCASRTVLAGQVLPQLGVFSCHSPLSPNIAPAAPLPADIQDFSLDGPLIECIY